MIIVDAHEDLAYNVLADGRDYLRSAYETRAEEQGSPIPDLNGQCMLGLPEWLQGNVAVIFSTLFTMPRHAAKAGEMSYPNPEGAYQQALAQLNIYRQWATDRQSPLTLITHRHHLEQVLASWVAPAAAGQVGLVLLMENADPIRRPADVSWWYDQGVRLIGPAWDDNRYTSSSRGSGGLTPFGHELLAVMAQHNLILDLSHMSDQACQEALQTYPGPIIASHSNPRHLVPKDRMLPNDIIEGIVNREGIVGIMPANWALQVDWQRGSGKDNVTLDDVVNAIDVVCQIAGDAFHVGLGTDFDGGFGAEAAPAELDTIADLPRLAEALARRGYREEHVTAVMSDNWLRLLRQTLPLEAANQGQAEDAQHT